MFDPKFAFSCEFLFVAGILTSIFVNFQFFWSDIFLRGFCNPFLSLLRLVCCLVNEDSLNCVRTCTMFYYFVEQKFASFYLDLPFFWHFAWNLFDFSKVISLLIAALIFSAGYYSAPFFLFRRIKKCFALPHFAAFSTFCVKSFWLL